MVQIISVANQKGGVGKTTTTINLGASIANHGYKVLIVDIDPQGNATSGLGIEKSSVDKDIYNVLIDEIPLSETIHHTETKNLDAVPATIQLAGAEMELTSMMARETRLKQGIDEVSHEYDFILIDCPPSLGQLSINAFTASDSILIPVQSEYYAMEGLSQLLNTIRLVQKHFNKNLGVEGVLLTMLDARTNLGAEVVKEVQSYFNKKVYKTIIPRITKLAEAPSYGQPITEYAPKSRGSQVYDSLAKEVLKAHGKNSKEPKKRGLGRGLEALFDESPQVQETEEITEIPLDEIRPNPYQPRKTFDNKSLKELSESIKENGVFQPIIIRKSVNGYEIIAGERRFRASKLAKKKTIPAIIRKFDEAQMMEVAVLENLQREDLTPLEEAQAYEMLQKNLGLTQAEVSKRLGKSRPYIANYLRLLTLPQKTKRLLQRGELSMGQARTLLGLKDKDGIDDLARKVVKNGITVRQLESLVAKLNEKEKKPKKKQLKNLPLFELVNLN